jgi:zinc transport system permease protein
MITAMTTGTTMAMITEAIEMIDEFIIRAALAGFAVALAAAPLGCLIVWRRMAYFGDATGHAALLGVVLGVALGLAPMLGVVVVAAAMALVVSLVSNRASFGVDTMLGVFAHSALALGLVAAALIPGARLNLLGVLQGDILLVNWVDVAMVWLGSLAIIAVISMFWRALINATLSPELMVAEGGSLLKDRLVLTLSLAVFVAVAMQLVGVLLITAMLILPAAAAAPIARSPEKMVAFAAGIGGLSVLGGLGLSLGFDTPAGPSIIVVAAVMFAAITLTRPR